jgi:hypothetical protein
MPINLEQEQDNDNFDNGRVAPGSASRQTVVGNAAFCKCRVNRDASLISDRVSRQQHNN